MIRWIFFDVGNVIMNDDAVMAYLYAELHRVMKEAGSELSFTELLTERERVIAQSGAGHWSVLAERYLGRSGHRSLRKSSASYLRGRYLEYHNLLPGMEAALHELAQNYRLAVIANQMAVAEEALRATGLEELFEFLVLSENLGLSKPERGIYEWGLLRANCEPAEVIMVGDRIDNDIAPAKELGMQTIWFHMAHHDKDLPVRNEYQRLYLDSQRRQSTARIGPSTSASAPAAEANSPEELLRQIHKLDSIHAGI